MSIKRYDPYTGQWPRSGMCGEMKSVHNGDWVKYEDHCAEVQVLLDKITRLKEMVERVAREVAEYSPF